MPDTLTDLGGGACFNDARVQVASLRDGVNDGSSPRLRIHDVNPEPSAVVQNACPMLKSAGASGAAAAAPFDEQAVESG